MSVVLRLSQSQDAGGIQQAYAIYPTESKLALELWHDLQGSFLYDALRLSLLWHLSNPTAPKAPLRHDSHRSAANAPQQPAYLICCTEVS